MSQNKPCVFCQIVRGEASAVRVFEDDSAVAFLDQRPVFFGHTLVVPRQHHETLQELPSGQLSSLFEAVQLIAVAVERGLGADGAWITVNNRVSQSVPHVHVHVVPRHFQDGLKGFFWPRQRYPSQSQMEDTAQKLTDAIEQMRTAGQL